MSDDIYQNGAFLDELEEEIERYTLQAKGNDRESLANALVPVQEALAQSKSAPDDKRQKSWLKRLLAKFKKGIQTIKDSPAVREHFNEATATILAGTVSKSFRESRRDFHETEGVKLDNEFKRRQLENGIRSPEEEIRTTVSDGVVKTNEITPNQVPPIPHMPLPYYSTLKMSPEEIAEHLFVMEFKAYGVVGRDGVLRIIASKAERIQ